MKYSFPIFAVVVFVAWAHTDEVNANSYGVGAVTNVVPTSSLSTKSKSTKAKPSARPRFTSDYTSLGHVECQIVESDESGGGFVREQCGSFKDVPLFRVEGDLRQSAYAGNEPTGQTTLGAFNYLTDKVEWRMRNERPIALIYRLKVDGIDMPDYGKTQLFVQKIGVGDEHSCIIGLVAGNYPKANEKAREIADTAAAITCSDDYQPKSYGDLL